MALPTIPIYSYSAPPTGSVGWANTSATLPERPRRPGVCCRIEQMQEPIAAYEQEEAVRDWNPKPRTSDRRAHTLTNVSISDEVHWGIHTSSHVRSTSPL